MPSKKTPSPGSLPRPPADPCAPLEKKALIERLLAKASLDFKCCGHKLSRP